MKGEWVHRKFFIKSLPLQGKIVIRVCILIFRTFKRNPLTLHPLPQKKFVGKGNIFYSNSQNLEKNLFESSNISSEFIADRG